MRWSLLFLFYFALSITLFAQREVIPIKGLLTGDNGELDISWSYCSSDKFVKYQLYCINKDIGSEENLIFETTDKSVRHFKYLEANADLEVKTYFLKTIYTDGEEKSKPVDNVYLNLSKLSNQAYLKWNRPVEGVFTFDYQILKGELGDLKLYANTNVPTYHETSYDCTSPEYYQLQTVGEDLCQFVSNKICIACFCNTQPLLPNIDSVSVIGNKVAIGWKPSTELKTVRYRIYRRQSGKNILIDYNDGINNTLYVDDAVDPCDKEIEYCIATVDSCGFVSALSSLQHNMIVLDYQYNTCERSVELKWSSYDNPSSEIHFYEVWGAESGRKPELLLRNKPDQLGALIKGLEINKTYNFFVRVKGAEFSSSSCSITISTTDYPRPDTVSLQQVSVDDEQFVQLQMKSDHNVYIQGYEVLRSDSEDGKYALIGFAAYQGEYPVNYEDHEALVEDNIYYYKLRLIDSCGYARDYSNILQTELLKGSQKKVNENSIHWNPYRMFDGGVSKYIIYRGVGENVIPNQLIDEVASSETTYTDDVSSFINTDGYYNYKVVAIPLNEDEFMPSNSNRIILRGKPIVMMPNAFRPNGVNNEFKPAGKDINPEGYVMRIFNRWGQEVYVSKHPLEGWNGRIGGSLAPEDVYVYQVIYYSISGEQFAEKGSFILLR